MTIRRPTAANAREKKSWWRGVGPTFGGGPEPLPTTARPPSSIRLGAPAGVLIATTLWLGAAMAQDTDSAIEQVPIQLGQPADVPEVGGAPKAIENEQTPAGDPAAAPQVGSAEESVGVEAQLTREEGEVRAPAQLYVGGRNAQASEPLTQRSEGRTGAIERVGGSDRCNQPQTDPAIQKACARVIETRAAEFARPDPPPLSPEQRLLVDQRLQEGRATARTAVRRLAEQGEADTPEGQAVASVALGDNAPGPAAKAREDEGAAVSAGTQAVIEALVGGLTGNPPPPQ